ncbi:MAG: hypothetical protein HF314_16935 [Ignavibacteria bacterium]|jgi:hypothetical protein|nr:hypothetical protein [Ignavibacteria bacterium]MCU7504771.1 hypothetical protein [Ignavibacteria bacterium]MCU7518360.1 hypothetical protein [Ignavibacteria bacterium]
MKFGPELVFILTTFSIWGIALDGCSASNPTLINTKKLHIYECKSEKLIYNLADSTKVIIYPGQNQDKAVLDMFENGMLTVKILKDAYKNEYKWYEFDAVKYEILNSKSDKCSDETDANTVFIQFSSSKIDADGSTLHNIEYFTRMDDGLYCFELKQIKQDHFAIRFTGFIL